MTETDFEKMAAEIVENFEAEEVSLSYMETIIECGLQAAHERGRREGMEEAARVAEGHKGSAAKKRGKIKPITFSSHDEHIAMVTEIHAEERGEDIASELIANAIRTLATKETEG